MFDENDGDDLEDRDFFNSFVAGDDESIEDDNIAMESSQVEETQTSNLTEDTDMSFPPTRQSSSVSTLSNAGAGRLQSTNVVNSNVVRSLPFTRQASSISSTTNNVSASILNPANVSAPISLPVIRRGSRPVAGGQGDMNFLGNIFMQNMFMNQIRWEEERKERAEERERKEEQRLIREQDRERERISREQERERDRQSFMHMMAMMMAANKSSNKDDDRKQN